MPDNNTRFGTVEPEQPNPADLPVEPGAPTDAATSPADLGRGSEPAVSPGVEVKAEPAANAGESSAAPVRLAKVGKAGDRIFSGLTVTAGFLIVAIVAFIGVFLIALSANSLARNHSNFLLSTDWQVTGNNLRFGIFGLLWTTVYTSIIALIIAVPVAIGIALLITHYVPGRLGRIVGFLIDLLAAVPSIIYGLWGAKVFGPFLEPLYNAIAPVGGEVPETKLPWGEAIRYNPLARDISSYGNVLTAGLVLAIMILPIITAISRDVFAQTPRDHIEAALALGSTRWEVIKTAVMPYGRSGVVAASMLGLGRALGETVAVMIILSATQKPGVSTSLFGGGETFASKIASAASEFDDARKTGAYIAAGLVLFVVTFIVNALARVVAESGKAKS